MPRISNHVRAAKTEEEEGSFHEGHSGPPVSSLSEKKKKKSLVIFCRSQGRCLRRCCWTQGKEQFPGHTFANFDGKRALHFKSRKVS
ncbi:hypothetical protein CEXT_805111 [Caerostris extrusa]|uniref:Uncharacterized protein n=1 Tax=Caerostris extrusa TaxID=172846 RepID=A0AAV4PID5_CAEEX|nr:hypothetical protein CEXT_805111 [Caerostris extrusa]